MDDDELTMRNSAISHAVYMFKDKSLAETDKGFWPMVHQIYCFMRTGNHAVPRPHYNPYPNDHILRGEHKTEHAIPEGSRKLASER